jgi:DNA-directed RNA polymerase specialized sigma24 family protein
MDQGKLFQRSRYFVAFEEGARCLLLSIVGAKVPGQDIWDVYQDALLNIWRAFNKIMEEGTIKNPQALASRIAQRQVADYWRTRSRRPVTLQLTVDPADPHLERIEEEETRLIKLTRSEKAILWMIGLGMRNDDMAARLHVSMNTLRTHIKNIHKKRESRTGSTWPCLRPNT